MTRFALFALVAACTPSNAAPPPVPLTTPDAPPPKPRDAPLSCKADGDCPHLACGPCKSGDKVLQRHVDIDCNVNPCPGTVAVCRAGTCVIR